MRLNKRPIVMLVVAVFIGLSMSLPRVAHTQSITVTFTKVADHNTPLPGETGNTFQQLNGPPSIHNGNVAFVGCTAGGCPAGSQGVYFYKLIDGSLTTVADHNTFIPGQ